MSSQKHILMLIFWLGAGVVLSAFILEYGFQAKPCEMCWWQRYVHWVIAVLAFVGWQAHGSRPQWVRACLLGVLVAADIGLLIAGWQSGAQLGLWELPAFCGDSGHTLAGAEDLLATLQASGPPPACDSWGFTILGLSLAMWNIPVMLLVGALSLWQLMKKKG